MGGRSHPEGERGPSEEDQGTYRAILVIISHIERSNRNEKSLLSNLNQTADVFSNDLVTLASLQESALVGPENSSHYIGDQSPRSCIRVATWQS